MDKVFVLSTVLIEQLKPFVSKKNGKSQVNEAYEAGSQLSFQSFQKRF